jgi:glutamyl-tRNA reductase
MFLAGIAAGAVALSRRDGGRVDSAALSDLKKSLAELDGRVTEQGAVQVERLQQIETRLDEHAVRLNEHTAKLAEVPTTSELISAMENLLQKTMSSLDNRLTSQANSIELLKTTVSQTDSLLERVLESLDSLQAYSEPGEPESVGALKG